MFPCTTQFGSVGDITLTTNEETLFYFILRTYSWRGHPVAVTEDMWVRVREGSVPEHPKDQGLSFLLDGYLFCLNAYGLNQYVLVREGAPGDGLEIEGVAEGEWLLVATVTQTGCAYYDAAIQQAARHGVVVELMGIVSWAAFVVNRMYGVKEATVKEHDRMMDVITGAMYPGYLLYGLSETQKHKIDQMRDLTQSYMANSPTETSIALESILEYASDVIDSIRNDVANYDTCDIIVRNFVCLIGLMLCGGIENSLLSLHPLLLCSYERAARARHGPHILRLLFEGYGQMQFRSLYDRLSREDFDFDALPAEPRLIPEHYNLSAPEFAAEQLGLDYDQGETVAFEDVAGRLSHIVRCDDDEQDIDMLSSRPEQQSFLPYVPTGAVLTAGALRRRSTDNAEMVDQIMRQMRRVGGLESLRDASAAEVAAFTQDMLRRVAAEDRTRNDGVHRAANLDTGIASDGEKYAPLYVVDVLRQIRPVVLRLAPLAEHHVGTFATTIAAAHMLTNPHHLLASPEASRVLYGCSYAALVRGMSEFAQDFRAYLEWVEAGGVGRRALRCSQVSMETNILGYLMVHQRTRSGYATLFDDDMTYRARCIFHNAVMAGPGGEWQRSMDVVRARYREYMKKPAIVSVFDLGIDDSDPVDMAAEDVTAAIAAA